MDKILIYCDISSNYNSDTEEEYSECPVASNITVKNEYSWEAPWHVILASLVKGLEAFYGYSFKKEKLHEFAEKYGS